jgi:regulation of enolase protein 1 (concanavalin A-like superfamily)
MPWRVYRSPETATNDHMRTAPALLLATLSAALPAALPAAETLNGHPVVLDTGGRIMPWQGTPDQAYDQFLRQRWNFIKTGVPLSPGPPPRSNYPQYYFYDGYVTNSAAITPDNWMNDVGEKIPSWFESARLYYAYTGDASVMTIAKNLIDYTIANGHSPSTFAWPDFPHTTSDYGDIVFTGFLGRFAEHEVQLDHAADMGLTYLRMWQFYGEQVYLDKALSVANNLAAHDRVGTNTASVWPYRVRLDTGAITSEYCANWAGAYELMDGLVTLGLGNTAQYAIARDRARQFLLTVPMATLADHTVPGQWTDGHADNATQGCTEKGNMSKSNATLHLFDDPDFDPQMATRIPALIDWTERWFVNRTINGEPATYFGANVVGEQDVFNYKMDYQTARYAAECARWYALSGDAAYKEKAFRAMNFVTYCSDAAGRATGSPFTTSIASWWSDCYGECPRMFYHVFAAIPEWAPAGQDRILYSYDVVKSVLYSAGQVRYTTTAADGTQYLRLSFTPSSITVAGQTIPQRTDLAAAGWTMRNLGGSDVAVTIRHTQAGAVVISGTPGSNLAPTVSLTSPAAGLAGTAPATITLSATATDADGAVAQVVFRQGTTVIGTDTTAPYSITWSGVAAGSYSLTAVATDDDGASTATLPLAITVAPPSTLPAPWLTQDVGAVGVAGSGNQASGTWTVAGSGTDIWESADGFRFVHRSLAGDGVITARVASLAGGSTWAMAGVMVRDGTVAGARHAIAAVTRAQGRSFTWRTATAGVSQYTDGGTGTAPVWVRLTRSGSTLTGAWSADGVSWSALGSATVSLPATTQVGLAVCAVDNSALATATFTNVTVTGGGASPARSITMSQSGPITGWLIAPAAGQVSTTATTTIFSGLAPAATHVLTPEAAPSGGG